MHSYLQRMICFVVSRSTPVCCVGTGDDIGDVIVGDGDGVNNGNLLAATRSG